MFKEAQLLLYSTNLKLCNMASNRWSSMVTVLTSILQNWEALATTLFKRSRTSALDAPKKQKELMEILAVVGPVVDLLKELQGNDATTGPRMVIGIARLLATTLDCSKPLVISDPEAKRKGVDMDGELSDMLEGPRYHGLPGVLAKHEVVRPHEDLEPSARAFRARLAVEIKKRLVNDRYKEGGKDKHYAYLFDGAVASHPALVELRHIDALAGSHQQGSVVKGRVLQRAIYPRLVRYFIHQAAEEAAAGSGGGAESGSAGCAVRGGQQQQTLEAGFAATTVGLDMFGFQPAAPAPAPVVLTPAQRACKAWEEYYNWSTSDEPEAATARANRWTQLPVWWSKEGKRLFPAMAFAFRCLFAVGASAAHLERDFSVGGSLFTKKRTRMTAAFAEVNLFLNLNTALIPPSSRISILTPEQMLAAMPPRVMDLESFKKFSVLSPASFTTDEAEEQELEEELEGLEQLLAGGGPTGQEWPVVVN